MSGEPKILLATLWHRTSAAGNEYLSGFLGKARLIGFRGEPTADGTPTWNLYLQAGDRPGDGSQPRRAPARRQVRPRPPADDGSPMPDDGVEDLWP